MNEEIELKNSLIKHMVLNIVSFAIILSIFALFMFFIMKAVTYSNIDEELINAKNELVRISEYSKIESEHNIPKLFNSNAYKKFQEEIKNNLRIISTKVSNPRINMIIWDESSDIIVEFGRISEYDDELSFNKNLLNVVYDKNIANKYNYRAINFIFDYNQDGTDDYCQLLMNVDTESYLVKSYFEIIVSAVIISIIVSILMSYILSKNTIRPIAENMRKHTEFIQNASHELRTPLTIIQAKKKIMPNKTDAKNKNKIKDISIKI